MSRGRRGGESRVHCMPRDAVGLPILRCIHSSFKHVSKEPLALSLLLIEWFLVPTCSLSQFSILTYPQHRPSHPFLNQDLPGLPHQIRLLHPQYPRRAAPSRKQVSSVYPATISLLLSPNTTACTRREELTAYTWCQYPAMYKS